MKPPLLEKPLRRFTGKGANNRKLSDRDLAEVVRLYTTPQPDGTWLGVTTIARRFGVRHGCIQFRLEQAGVEMRDARQAHARGKRCKPIVNLPIGQAPECKCGCGRGTAWSQRRNRWAIYVKGHYTQRGQQGPTYADGRSHEPYVEDWPDVSLAIRRRDGFKCQRCRGDSRRLHVHHIDTDKLNNDSANLITLCASCHGAVHAELRKGVVPSCQG